ncbi:MAG: hypothetical protein JWL72_3986 [Ilumatobacteraceae bacterium]|nr:hypothetical protein [Ilumatobacteraceae bacterium]
MADAWVPKMQRWLQGHGGIIDIATLVEFGMPRRSAYRLTDSDDFELIMPGVLRSTHWPIGPTQLMTAACLRSRHAVISRVRAAREWKFRGLPADDGDVHALIPHGRHAELPGVIIHKCRRIDPVDVVQRGDGIRVTSPTRTMFDCADLLGVKRTGSIFEQLIDENKGTFATHASTLSRLGAPGRSGTRTMSAVIASRPTWRSAMQSELEVLVLREIERQLLPAPTTQLWFVLRNGDRVRLDFAWPALKVALEVDHPFWHAGIAECHRDKVRDRKMAAVGWQTLRVTDLDVSTGLPAAIADLAATIALR